MTKYRRHPADVTADRLIQHTIDYYERLDGRDRDDFSHVIFLLREIAEGNR